MCVIKRIRERVIQYCNLHNEEPLIRAIITRFHRNEKNFDVLHHILQGDRTGHTIGCGCEYCRLLYAYRKNKILTHQSKKRLEWDFDIGPIASHNWLTEAIEKQKERSQEIRNSMVTLGEILEIPNSIKRKST